jgi:two-component system KDP operon response regulator KdpE
MPQPLILVVESEAVSRKALRLALRGEGYKVCETTTGSDAIAKALHRVPDAIILGLHLPDVDGMRVLTSIREKLHVPIIALSLRADEGHLIRVLDAGANDYVVKPFREGELMARLRAALRASQYGNLAQEVIVGELRIELVKHRVFVGAREVVLTPTEFRLLYLLASEAGQVLSHGFLLQEVWGPAQVREIQYVRVYMKQLRHKLEDDPEHPKRLLTAPGIGYRLARN